MTESDQRIAVVLFDADGVIQRFEEGWLARAGTLSGSDDRGDEFMQELFLAEQPSLRGEGDFRTVIADVLARWSSPHSVDDVIAMWRRIEIFHDAHDVVRLLQASGIPCHLASNQEEQRSSYMSNELGYARLFDGEHYSWEVGAMKPDQAYFERVAARVGQPADRLLFFDDKPENVDAARAAGWQSEQYYYRSGPDTLRQLLSQHGLLV